MPIVLFSYQATVFSQPKTDSHQVECRRQFKSALNILVHNRKLKEYGMIADPWLDRQKYGVYLEKQRREMNRI